MAEQITMQEYVEIRKFLDENLIYGAELERAIPVAVNAVRMALGSKAESSNEFWRDDFVCKSDGTVQDGNEIVLSGKKFDFRTLYHKLKHFEEIATKLNAQPFNDTCSTHLSFLTTNHIKIKGVVIKNIFQLSRAFAPALCYISGATKGRYSRSRILDYAKPNMNISPFERDLIGLKGSTGKYSLCNISKNLMIDNNNVSGIFIEFRNPDGIRIPSVISALFFLHKAIIYKALKLSLKDCVSVESLCGSETEWRATKVLAELSIGRPITSSFKKMLIEQANKMIQYLMPELKEMKDSDIFIPILQKLADKSVSLRYSESSEDINKLNLKIDKEMLNGRRVDIEQLNATEEKILQILLAEAVVATSLTSLKTSLSAQLDCTQRTIENAFAGIEDKMGKRICIQEQAVMFR